MAVTFNPTRIGSLPTSTPAAQPTSVGSTAPGTAPVSKDLGAIGDQDYSSLSSGDSSVPFELREAKEDAKKVDKIYEEKYPEGLKELPQDEQKEVNGKRDDWMKANGSNTRKTIEALNKAIIEAEESGDDDKVEELMRIKSSVEIRGMQNSSIEGAIKQAASQAEDAEKKLRDSK